MGLFKAPRKDNFFAIFFQHFWNVMGEDDNRFCLGILNEGKEFDKANETEIMSPKT